MSEVNIRYDGSSIATMDASGTKTLLTAGKYCPASFQVEYNRPAIPDLPTDVPVFTVACAGSSWAPQSATCNMTQAEVLAWINQNSPDNLAGIYVIERNGENTRTRPVLFMRNVTTPEFTVYHSLGFPAYDLDYHTGFIYINQPSWFRHEELSITSNGIQSVDSYIDSLNVETEHLVGLERDANDNYVFTESFSDITDAYTMGQELLVAVNTLTDVYVDSVRYEESPDPDTHPEDAFFWVTIIEVASDIVQVPTPDGTMNVENMRHTCHDIILHYDDTIEDTPGSVFYMVDGLAFGTEAQPSDVTAGRVFINSNGIQVGTSALGNAFVVPVWVAEQGGERVGYIDVYIDTIVEAYNNGRTILAHVPNTNEYYEASVYYDSTADEWIFSTVIQDEIFGNELDNHFIPIGIRKTIMSSAATNYIEEERIFWWTALASEYTEATPSDVPTGKVFFNSSGAHLGTAT